MSYFPRPFGADEQLPAAAEPPIDPFTGKPIVENKRFPALELAIIGGGAIVALAIFSRKKRRTR